MSIIGIIILAFIILFWWLIIIAALGLFFGTLKAIAWFLDEVFFDEQDKEQEDA